MTVSVVTEAQPTGKHNPPNALYKIPLDCWEYTQTTGTGRITKM